MNKRQINQAIRHTGLTIHGNRGDYYFYFLDADENQIGESVMVAFLNHRSINEWVKEAEAATSSSEIAALREALS